MIYDLLFRTAADTLLTIAADPRHLGTRIGLTAVLHTWGSAMTHHPHVHVAVPGGGLSPDGSRWVACRPGFFLPVRVLSRLFRRLFLDRLAEAHRAGPNRLPWQPRPACRPRCFRGPPRAEAPGRLWVADITFVPTAAGFVSLAVVLDAFSRKIVGWTMAHHLRAELVLEALDMAVGQRRPRSVIHHSDQGQYTLLAFGKRCEEAGVRPSVGSVGDAYDNAMCESFFSTLEAELLARRRFQSHAEARMACFSSIEGWYNPHRRHSALGDVSPIPFERDRARSQEAR